MVVRPDPSGLQKLDADAPEWGARFEVWGAAPVQAFGTVLGRELYFRARHEQWSFEVADHLGRFPSDGFAVSDGFYHEESYPDASDMPLHTAVRLIERCLRRYLGPG